MTFTNYILSDRRSMTPRDRELLILRTGYLCRSDYEWAAHAALGLRIGLTNEELSRITRGPDAAGWSRPTPRSSVPLTSSIAISTSPTSPGRVCGSASTIAR